MKVLLDENLPHLLRNNLGGHEVFTVRFRGWAGLKNGELLKAAEDEGFDVFITGDQTLPYEQNLTKRRVATLVLSCIDWTSLRTTCRPSSPRSTTLGLVPFRKSNAAALPGTSSLRNSPQ